MKKYFAKEDGQGLVEYGLIISLVAIVSIVSLSGIAGGLSSKYDAFANVLEIEQLEDGSYLITTEDGVEIYQKNLKLGRLIGDYTGDKKDIQIPSSMNGWALKEIYQDVFKGKGLTSVAFDEGISLVQIHARAFQNNELSSISLPNGLEKIDVRAFYNNNLTEITLPTSVKTIQLNAFDGNDIRKVSIGSDVSVAANSFSNPGFADAYKSDNGGAGTYVYVNGNWVKQ